MRIINGVERAGRVVTLVELQELVELTADGFRAMQPGTLDAIAARLRAEDADQLWLFAELQGDARAR